MAVTMLIGNNPIVEFLPFGRGDSIPSVIAQELSNANSDLEFSVLIEMGLILFAVTLLMNVLARLLIWQVGRSRSSSKESPRITITGVVFALFVAFCLGFPWYIRDQFLIWSEVIVTVVALAVWGVTKLPGVSRAITEQKRANSLMTAVLGVCLVVTCIPLFLIMGYILYRGVVAELGLFHASAQAGG